MSGPATESCRVLITAGPTHEPIDAVRYIANRSSGRMGLAIAAESVRRGNRTTLLLGPVPERETWPEEDSQHSTVRFRTTADLQRALAKTWPDHDVLIMAAAVADYRPRRGDDASDSGGGKLRRRSEGLTLDLEATPDLVAGLEPTTRDDQTIVGFALEPAEGLLEAARRKLERKGLDAIVANPLETMDAETVTATLVWKDGREDPAPAGLAKSAFAAWLLERVLTAPPR